MGGPAPNERAPTKEELALLARLLSEAFPGSSELRAQAKSARARTVGPAGAPQVLFDIDETLPRAPSDPRIPIEGEVEDQDGTLVHVLLHVVGGRLNELEIYREDGRPVVRFPTPTTLRILK